MPRKSNPTRILMVASYFHPYVSGVTQYARALAEALAPTHDVTVLTGWHDKRLPEQESCDGYRIERAKLMLRIDKGYVSPAFIARYCQLQRQADVINLHLPMLDAGLLTNLTRKPLVTTYQCDMAYEGGLVRRCGIWATRTSGALALRQSDRIVTLSRDYAESSRFAARHIDKVVPVFPPNRFAQQARDELKTQHDQPISVSQRPLVVGFVGRFVSEKGIEVLLKAAEYLDETRFRFRLAGDYESVAGGSVFRELQPNLTRLGDRVELCGSISDNDLFEFYKSIDIFCLPSVNRFEAFGLVQLEAMSLGALPVVSNLPGVRVLVRETGLGELVEPGDAKGLAAALQMAALHLPRIARREIAERALRLGDADQFGRRYSDIFRDICRSSDE